MQLALRANSLGHDYRSGSSASTSRVNKFLVAGVTVAGAAAIALNPLAPNVVTDIEHKAAADIEHRAVRLTSGIGDVLGSYQGVVTQAGANLQNLGNEAAVALPALLQAITTSGSTVAAGLPATANLQTLSAVAAALPGLLQAITNLSGSTDLVGTALSGAATGLQNALYGGWYGGDDGFVFGLFGGTVTANGVTESGSTLQEILGALAKGDTFDAFGYAEEWSLEVVDHTLKPLLSPILNTAKVGAAPTATIPGELLQSLADLTATLPTPLPGEVVQTLTNLTATFLNYSNLKAAADAVLSPALSVSFGLVEDLGKIATDVSSANVAGALTDALKVPADLTGDLLNGYVNPNTTINPTGAPFTGLLNSGSLLDDVLSTWPKQFAAALAPLTTATTAAPATTAALSTPTKDTAQTALAKAISAATAAKTKAAADTTKDTGTKDTSTKDTSSSNGTDTPRVKHGWGRKNADSSTKHRGAHRAGAGTKSTKDAGTSHRRGKHSAASHSGRS